MQFLVKLLTALVGLYSNQNIPGCLQYVQKVICFNISLDAWNGCTSICFNWQFLISSFFCCHQFSSDKWFHCWESATFNIQPRHITIFRKATNKCMGQSKTVLQNFMNLVKKRWIAAFHPFFYKQQNLTFSSSSLLGGPLCPGLHLFFKSFSFSNGPTS